MSNTQFFKNYLAANYISLPLYIIVLLMLLPGGCRQSFHEQDYSLHINRSVSYAKKNFTDPPIQYKSRPLWFWNTQLSSAQTLEVMVDAKAKGYYGLGILPSHGISPEYMSPGFFEHYKYALKVADSLKMKMSFYDEFYFPSGIAGGNLLKYYPEAVSNSFIGRLQLMLQGGQHTADLAILYPISSLQADYNFEKPGDHNMGGNAPDCGKLSNGNFSCVHKKMDGKDIYFFANSSDDELEIPVKLRGKMKITKWITKWDPHTGTIEKYPSSVIRDNGSAITKLQLKLGPVESVFFVAE
jgi:hypothetical protein